MAISWQKMSALVIILGSVLFLIAAFSPISFRVFPEPSAARKLEVMTASPTAWFVAQILFALGAMVTMIGIALVGRRKSVGDGNQPAQDDCRCSRLR
jgi:hypothetical protein